MNRVAFAFSLVLAAAPVPVSGQDAVAQVPPKAVAASDIFSGTITELSDESLTVVRSAFARESVKRVFILDSATVVEGKLKAKARVTVQYNSDETGQFHAIRIIVR